MGYIFGVLNALTVSFQNAQVRELSLASPIYLNCVRFFAATVSTAFLITILSGWQQPEPKFWILVVVAIPLEYLFALCHVKAYQLSPQSLIGPLTGLTGVFLIPVAYFVLGETPNSIGITGVVSILLGGLILGWSRASSGIRGAITGLIKERGVIYVIIAALTSSVTVTLTKWAFTYSSPLFFGFYISLGLFIVYGFSYMLSEGRNTGDNTRALVGMGGAFGLGQIFHYVGLSLILSSYYISLKRLSIVFDVFFGWWAGDTEIQKRLLAALIMTAGAILIIFGQI